MRNKPNGAVIEPEALPSDFEEVCIAAYSFSSSQRHNAFQIHRCALLGANGSRSHPKPIN
jgi:hypothetical protein